VITNKCRSIDKATVKPFWSRVAHILNWKLVAADVANGYC